MVAITGASGVIYGVRTAEALHSSGAEVHLIVSKTAEKLLKLETGRDLSELSKSCSKLHNPEDIFSELSSGSNAADAMVVVPCSMKTLSKIANGISDDLICRAAEVVLKQGKKLVLVPRETPLNSIHLENMLKLQKAGAVILPASPAFYHAPKNIMDLVDYIVGRILEVLGLPHELYERWAGGDPDR